ncbi:MAG: protein-L-isoaspartate O-methyltransferase [Pseudomonadota bacterium]|nr:protein-L-isoaspartate O-methyltransferase [Gammaproteobacteria bacterium]MDQ3583008.1 protein-L-isoaspartate O-methyltransferase [Pseudomonadota bacterium]
MNFEQARSNMIEQQIRTWEVLDQRVLDLLGSVPREDFVPPRYRSLAFSDTNIPLGFGEVMMAPKVEARMLQVLAVEPGDRILEIGTGSGYVTALLARSGREVTTVEIHPELSAGAKVRVSRQGLDNVRFEVGTGLERPAAEGGYDVIAVTGSLPLYTDHFEKRLAVCGRVFLIVGQAPVMEAMLVTRVGAREVAREGLFETDLPPLRGAPTPKRFVF